MPTDLYSNSSGLFEFTKNADYTFRFDATSNKVVMKTGLSSNFNEKAGVTLADGDGIFKTADFDFSGVGHINLAGINLLQANTTGDYKFAISEDLDHFLGDLIQDRGIAGALETLSVNGGKEGAFAVLWDYIDNHYSYYNTEINKYAIQLGAEYVKALNNDTVDALTGIIVKFAPDSADAGTALDRVQSLHDNLLGNFDVKSIADKFLDGDVTNNPGNVSSVGGFPMEGSNGTPDEASGLEMAQLSVNLGVNTRPYYGGYEGEVNNATTWDHANHPEWFI